MSVDRLIEAIERKKNPTVLGLDPQPEHIPPEILNKHIERPDSPSGKNALLEGLCGATEEYVLGLLDALCGVVPAVKPQCAFYEALGPGGAAVLQRVILAAKERGLYVIADAKRGDIDSTAKAYSSAYLGRTEVMGELVPVYDADALTVNPYLGSDNLKAFMKDCKDYEKMVFVLCKTSNRSSVEVQELMAGDRPLYRVIAEQISRAGRGTAGQYGYQAAGIVAGATYPETIRQLREWHPELFFLVPGYGSQGGKGADASAAFDKLGRGAVVNNSRGICCAWQKTGKPYKDAALKAALDMRGDLTKYIY